MHRSMKLGIFAMFAVAALVVSAAAAPAPMISMGVVVEANNATLNASPVANLATISNGDTLSTGNAGALRARVGSSQIYLFPNSNVSLGQTLSGFSADLSGGSVLLSSNVGEAFEVLSDGAVVRSAPNQKNVAQISWVSPSELLLTSRLGNLEVTMGDETRTVNQGASYRMMIAPASQPAGAAAMHASGAGSGTFVLVAVGIVAAGTGVALWRAFESTNSTN